MSDSSKVTEYYQDRKGEWRWRTRDLKNRIRDPQGEIVGAASEGFASKQKAKENYEINRGTR